MKNITLKQLKKLVNESEEYEESINNILLNMKYYKAKDMKAFQVEMLLDNLVERLAKAYNKIAEEYDFDKIYI